MRSSKKFNILTYIKDIFSKTGDIVTGGIIGLILFVLSFYMDFPVFKIISLIAVFAGFIVASYKVWEEQDQEIREFKDIRLDISIKRTNVETNSMLELVNTGMDDIIDLKIKIPDRYLPICNQNSKLVFASEIEPSIIRIGEKLLARFPAAGTKVLVTGKGRISQKDFRKEKTI